MKREDILKEMKDAVGTKEPIEFFAKMTDAFGLLFDHIDRLEGQLHRIKTQSALSIQWEPRVASDLLAKQVDILRQDKDTYFTEIDSLKKAFAEDRVTQNYHDFCTFWQETLGWHPFLD
jgi:hypothetical protein